MEKLCKKNNNTNISSNKDINISSSTNENDNILNEKNINSINEEEKIWAKQIGEYKSEEITLNKKIIIDSITLYNIISTNYGYKKLDINRLAQGEQKKALLEIKWEKNIPYWWIR